MRKTFLCALLVLGGCAAKPPQVVTRIKIVRPTIPAALLSCPPAPPVPASQAPSAVARYVVSLWEAHGICHDHLDEVKHTLDKLDKTASAG